MSYPDQRTMAFRRRRSHKPIDAREFARLGCFLGWNQVRASKRFKLLPALIKNVAHGLLFQ
jgi:hypothetical protein